MLNSESVSLLRMAMMGAGLFCGMANMLYAADSDVNRFSVTTGATRIIYNPASAGASLTVENPQDYPMLVQSSVFEEDKKTKAAFVTTPPLFRLDGKQSSRIRIIRTGGVYPSNRETLNWLCVRGVPPKADDVRATPSGAQKGAVIATAEIAITTCIKLLIRPPSVTGTPQMVADQITWTKDGTSLIGNNPTPFYMNLSGLSAGGGEIGSPDFIAPYSRKTFRLPPGTEKTAVIKWTVLTDLGGISRQFSSAL